MRRSIKCRQNAQQQSKSLTENTKAVLHDHHDDALRYHGLEPMVVQSGAQVEAAAVDEHHNGQGFLGVQGILGNQSIFVTVL